LRGGDRPFRGSWHLIAQLKLIARLHLTRRDQLAIAVEHVVMRRHLDAAGARLDGEQAVLRIAPAPARRGDRRDEGPLPPVPYLDQRSRLEALRRGALPAQRDEVRRRPDRDDAVGAYEEGRILTYTLMIEENPGGRVEVVRLAVVDRDEVAVDLRHAIGRAGIEGRHLVLRNLAHLAEHLARGGLVEARLRTHFAHRLEHARDAHSCELGRQRRLDPRDRDKRHRGQVVDLGGPRRAQRVHQRTLVKEVALVERDLVTDVLDALEFLRRGTAHHAVDLIALLEQQLGEVRAVLAGDAGDQRRARAHARRAL